MHQEEFVYDEIASPREIMLVSRNVSYDDQNCRPLLRLQLRQYRQPQDGAGTGRGTRLLALWTGGFHGRPRPARPVVRRDARRRFRPGLLQLPLLQPQRRQMDQS